MHTFFNVITTMSSWPGHGHASLLVDRSPVLNHSPWPRARVGARASILHASRWLRPLHHLPAQAEPRKRAVVAVDMATVELLSLLERFAFES